MNNLPLTCWLLHGGSVASKRQLTGITNFLGFSCQEKIITSNPFLKYVPLSLQFIYYLFFLKKTLPGPYPTVIIGTGRRIAPILLAIKFLTKGKCFAIFVQKPHFGKQFFDLIIAPEHDGLIGKNVLNSLGAINNFSNAELTSWSPSTKALSEKLGPPPIIGVFLGGATKHYLLSLPKINDLIATLKRMTTEIKGAFIITTSRRSGPLMEELLKKEFKSYPHVLVYTSSDPYNPYVDMLKLADYFIVTEDSVNLVSEACFTGRPVYLLALPDYKQSQRKQRFIHRLIETKRIRYYQAPLSSWDYPPLRESERLAPDISSRLSKWLNAKNIT